MITLHLAGSLGRGSIDVGHSVSASELHTMVEEALGVEGVTLHHEGEVMPRVGGGTVGQGSLCDGDCVCVEASAKWELERLGLEPSVYHFRKKILRAENKTGAERSYYTELLLTTHPSFLSERGNDDDTLLHIAAGSGCVEVVTTLLCHGADVSSTNRRGQTPLCVAASKGCGGVVSLLLSHGAGVAGPPNAPSPLWLAAQHGDYPMSRALLEHGAVVDCQTRAGITPLWIASHGGHADVVTLLLDHGADHSKSDNYMSKSPLWIAVRGSHVEAVLELLRQGADPKQPNLFSETPLQVSTHPAITSALQQSINAPPVK